MKVYNKGNRTYGLKKDGKVSFMIKPASFTEIPAEYTGDITFRAAVAAGELVPYESVAQADKIEKAAEEEKAVKKTRVKHEKDAE